MQVESLLSSSGGPLVENPDTNWGKLMLERGVGLILALVGELSPSARHDSVREILISKHFC